MRRPWTYARFSLRPNRFLASLGIHEERPAEKLLNNTAVHLEAILFDIDGTLVDSNDIHARCWIEAFAHFGKRVEWDVVRHQIGKGGDLLVPDLLNAREMRKFGEELKEYRSELFKQQYLPRVKPFPGIGEVLHGLAERGIAIALASSANADEVRHYVDLLGISDLLEASTSKDDANLSKPSPEIFQSALEQAGSDPARTLVVGDTPYDVLAAHRAALAVAAVLCGGFERGLLEKAEFLFRDVSELAANLDAVEQYFASE